jgi:hypothetical protein
MEKELLVCFLSLLIELNLVTETRQRDRERDRERERVTDRDKTNRGEVRKVMSEHS